MIQELHYGSKEIGFASENHDRLDFSFNFVTRINCKYLNCNSMLFFLLTQKFELESRYENKYPKPDIHIPV